MIVSNINQNIHKNNHNIYLLTLSLLLFFFSKIKESSYSPGTTNSSSLDCLNLIVQSINTPSASPAAAVTSVPSIVITPPDIKATAKINYLSKFQQKCAAQA